mmetsp:Transcript_5483/g.11515  ORF Transcript_5483/g.11515 Transcript_5483/m.11515 type:complete len:250 (+) Transcript_5483:329-1078(+)
MKARNCSSSSVFELFLSTLAKNQRARCSEQSSSWYSFRSSMTSSKTSMPAPSPTLSMRAKASDSVMGSSSSSPLASPPSPPPSPPSPPPSDSEALTPCNRPFMGKSLIITFSKSHTLSGRHSWNILAILLKAIRSFMAMPMKPREKSEPQPIADANDSTMASLFLSHPSAEPDSTTARIWLAKLTKLETTEIAALRPSSLTPGACRILRHSETIKSMSPAAAPLSELPALKRMSKIELWSWVSPVCFMT